MQSPDQTQQYEVLLLMEYCSGLGLIDFMNTRLTQRLLEAEVLSIMGQISTAVAMCHHLDPPLIHRDIKIENVLIDDNGTYKLCDFGSAVNYCKAPSNQLDLVLLHEDIMQHTTPQYRAPEMIDLSRSFPIDDKSDVWALGVFLYKLCYFTTPFELPHQRTLQDLEQLILSCLSNLRFPHTPRYSSRLQNVMSCCLREDPRRRPNALQLLQEVCQMQNITMMPDVIPYSVKVQQLTNMSLANSSKKLVPSKLEEEMAHTRNTLKKELLEDAFAKIDKSRLLKIKSHPNLKPRPKSEIYHSNQMTSYSSTSLHNLVQQQVDATNKELNNMRKYEDLDQDTVEFLRSKEEGLSSRQNTGGSFKAAIRNGLRNFSTGGSIKSQRSGSQVLVSNHTKEKYPNEQNKNQTGGELKKRSSIQRRVQQLLLNKDSKTVKTASGYGRYTDQDDISAINKYELPNNDVTEPLSPTDRSTTSRFDFDKKTLLEKNLASMRHEPKPEKSLQVPKSRTHKKELKPPPCPPSLQYRIPQEQFEAQKKSAKSSEKKRPPPVPSKPQHLKVDETRIVSNASSDLILPDLDDLEKLFSRRYPSYV